MLPNALSTPVAEVFGPSAFLLYTGASMRDWGR